MTLKLHGVGQPTRPEVPLAVGRGALGRCPACGGGKLFGRFLKVAPACSRCGQPFGHHRADDFPPYIVMFVVGHLVGYGIYISETRLENVPLWLHATLWPTLAVALCVGLLQPVKGAVIGLQYGLGMHGFGQGPPGPIGREDGDGGARPRRAAEIVLRDGRPSPALAEPASAGRGDPDGGRPLG